MTLQNPSTVQTIHFTQLTLLYRQLLSEIETGYYWTVWKIQLCGTIKLLEVCYSTSQWTWHVVSSSGFRSDLWTQSLEISLSEIFLWIFAISLHWKDQTNYTGKTHCETLHITDTLWLLSLVWGRRKIPRRSLYLKIYEWVFLENTMGTINEWTQRSRHSASILTLTLPCHPYSDRADFCSAWCSQIILQQQHTPCSTHEEFSLGQLCTRGWCSFKDCRGSAPIPSVFPPVINHILPCNQCPAVHYS